MLLSKQDEIFFIKWSMIVSLKERSYIIQTILTFPGHELNLRINLRQCKSTSHEVRNLDKNKCLTSSFFFLARSSALCDLE